MTQGDFYGSEQSISIPQETTVSIELHKADGTLQKLKEGNFEVYFFEYDWNLNSR